MPPFASPCHILSIEPAVITQTSSDLSFLHRSFGEPHFRRGSRAQKQLRKPQAENRSESPVIGATRWSCAVAWYAWWMLKSFEDTWIIHGIIKQLSSKFLHRIGGNGSVVEHPLCMRKVRGSIPRFSIIACSIKVEHIFFSLLFDSSFLWQVTVLTRHNWAGMKIVVWITFWTQADFHPVDVCETNTALQVPKPFHTCQVVMVGEGTHQ